MPGVRAWQRRMGGPSHPDLSAAEDDLTMGCGSARTSVHNRVFLSAWSWKPAATRPATMPDQGNGRFSAEPAAALRARPVIGLPSPHREPVGRRDPGAPAAPPSPRQSKPSTVPPARTPCLARLVRRGVPDRLTESSSRSRGCVAGVLDYDDDEPAAPSSARVSPCQTARRTGQSVWGSAAARTTAWSTSRGPGRSN
jgi:hypothetical protein